MLALIWPHTTTATTAYGKRVVDSFLSTLERAGDAQEGVVFDVGSNDGGSGQSGYCDVQLSEG